MRSRQLGFAQGKYHVPYFTAKARVQDYVTSKYPDMTSICPSPAYFMTNFVQYYRPKCAISPIPSLAPHIRHCDMRLRQPERCVGAFGDFARHVLCNGDNCPCHGCHGIHIAVNICLLRTGARRTGPSCTRCRWRRMRACRL